MSVLVALLAGCMPAATVRTADVLAPGGLGVGMTAAVGGWSFGTATLEEDGESFTVPGNGARGLGEAPSTAGGIMAYGYGAALAWGLRVGVAPGVELGVQYGFGRLSLEARAAALDEDRGAPLSLAPAVTVAREPWHPGAPLWWRIGADASRRHHLHDREHRTPAVGLWLSGGGVRQLQHMLGKEHGYPITDCVEGWPGTPCGTPNPHTKGRVEVERDELVLSMPVSLSRQSLSERGGTSLTAGLVPQLALWSSAPRGLVCSGCREGLTAQGYAERWQLTAEVAFSGVSARGLR